MIKLIETKRFLSLLLTALMIISLIPSAAFTAFASGDVIDKVELSCDLANAVPDYSRTEGEFDNVLEKYCSVNTKGCELSKSSSAGLYYYDKGLYGIGDGSDKLSEDKDYYCCYIIALSDSESCDWVDSVKKLENNNDYNISEVEGLSVTVNGLSCDDAFIKYNKYRNSLFVYVPLNALYTAGGTTGDCDWLLDANKGEVSVTGSGATADYKYETKTPWYSLSLSVLGSIKNISIGPNVTHIGDNAFNGLYDVENVELGNIESIGEKAFYGSELKSLTIPDSVKSIGAYAFSGCRNLLELTIGKGVETIANNAFYDSRSLNSVMIKSDKITEIGEKAFGHWQTGQKTKDFIIYGVPGTAAETYASENGFAFMDYTKINIKSGFIGDCYWEYNPDTEVFTVGGSGTFDWDDDANEYLYKAKHFVVKDGVYSIGDSILLNADKIETVETGNVRIIGADCFQNCENLKSVTLSDGLKEIGNGSFSEIPLVTEIEVPESVETIVDGAFTNNSEDFKLIVIEGSAAQTYAELNGIKCEVVENPKTPINEVNITVEKPEYNKVWDYTPLVTGECRCSGLAVFRLGEDDCYNDVPLVEGTYEAQYVLEANDGYEFIKGEGDTVETKVILNGEECVNVGQNSVYDISKRIEVKYIFEIKKPEETEPQETTVPAETTETQETTAPADKPTEPQETTTPVDKPTEPQETTTPVVTPTESQEKTIKKPNPIKVTVKTKSVKLKKLKKKAQTVKAITVKSAQGKMTYKLVKKGSTAKIFKLAKINSKGVIKINKWKKAKKGDYKLKVKITAAGNKNYNKKTVSKVVKVKIK